MSKESKKLSLSHELYLLVRRYLDLSNNFFESRDSLYKRKEEFFETGLQDKNRFEREQMFFYEDKIKNSTNAFLTYSFSLFEIFLEKILLDLVKNDPITEERFLGKWDNLFNSGNHKNYNLHVKILRDESQLYQNYDILLRDEKKTLLEFISSILEISHPTEDPAYKEYMSHYHIYREVRNTLTHRGDCFDNKILNSLRSNKFLKKNPEYLIKFYQKNLEKDSSIKDLQDFDTSPLLNKPIRLEFLKTISSLIFIASWLSIQIEPDEKGGGSVLTNQYNEISNFCFENKSFEFLYMSLSLFKICKKHVFSDDIHQVPDIDIFNFLLANDLLWQLRERLYKKIKKNPPKVSKARIDKILLNIKNSKKKYRSNQDTVLKKYFFFSNLDQDLQDLLKHYLFNKKKDFFNTTRKLSLEERDYDEWFIFKKYQNSKEFKLIKSSK